MASTLIAVPLVGVDLVRVQDVADSVERFKARYLDRVFTPAEQAYCAAEPAVRIQRLAARFAAKEAVVKVLRPEGARPEWTSIEVVRTESGACDLRLTGTAAALAADAGITALAVSLTHEHDHAAAAVVGLCAPGSDSDDLLDELRRAASGALPAPSWKELP
jgi:holo-[acyl-carrier protein] synthase